MWNWICYVSACDIFKGISSNSTRARSEELFKLIHTNFRNGARKKTIKSKLNRIHHKWSIWEPFLWLRWDVALSLVGQDIASRNDLRLSFIKINLIQMFILRNSFLINPCSQSFLVAIKLTLTHARTQVSYGDGRITKKFSHQFLMHSRVSVVKLT